MRRAGDRQKLCKALNYSQKKYLQERWHGLILSCALLKTGSQSGKRIGRMASAGACGASEIA
jgi:hypothetical protein